ncbi:THAP domain-containing protein 1 [Armadillidium vulgare]|nr:THAP domain-containing protein 1 [Armadillidium vulgare]
MHMVKYFALVHIQKWNVKWFAKENSYHIFKDDKRTADELVSYSSQVIDSFSMAYPRLKVESVKMLIERRKVCSYECFSKGKFGSCRGEHGRAQKNKISRKLSKILFRVEAEPTDDEQSSVLMSSDDTNCIEGKDDSKSHMNREKVISLIFPLTNKKLTKIWVMKMKRGNFRPSKFSKLCSDHFTPDCIRPKIGFGKPTLKPNAFPTIFNFSTSLKTKKGREHCIKTRNKAILKKQVHELNKQEYLNNQPSESFNQSTSKPANYLVILCSIFIYNLINHVN